MSIDKEDFFNGGKNILARSLRAYRLQRNLSQAELADACGVTQATISEIETGKGNPTFEVICKLAMALDVPPFALIGAGAALGTLGAVMAAKSVGDVIGRLLAKTSNAQVEQWVIDELLQVAKHTVTKLEKKNTQLTTSVKDSEQRIRNGF
jgi:transcriptional regulator with XRE-family HTH domain